MKRVFMLGFAVLVVFTWIGPATAAEYKATWKLASTQSMDHPYMVGAQKFADLMKERTNGRITVKLYPSNQLGKGEREMTEGIQQGAIDLLVTSTGPLGGFSPSINILDFPFLFRDFKHVDLVLDGAIGQKLLDDFCKGQHQGPGLLGKRIPQPDQLQGAGQEGRGRQGAQDPDHGEQGASGRLEGRGAESHPHGLGRGVHGAAAEGHRRPGKPDRRLLQHQALGCRPEVLLAHRARLLPLAVPDEPEGLQRPAQGGPADLS